MDKNPHKGTTNNDLSRLQEPRTTQLKSTLHCILMFDFKKKYLYRLST